MGFLPMGRFKKKLCSSQEMKALRLKIILKWVIELGFDVGVGRSARVFKNFDLN